VVIDLARLRQRLIGILDLHDAPCGQVVEHHARADRAQAGLTRDGIEYAEDGRLARGQLVELGVNMA
jgi:hypothetical protein